MHTDKFQHEVTQLAEFAAGRPVNHCLFRALDSGIPPKSPTESQFCIVFLFFSSLKFGKVTETPQRMEKDRLHSDLSIETGVFYVKLRMCRVLVWKLTLCKFDRRHFELHHKRSPDLIHTLDIMDWIGLD